MTIPPSDLPPLDNDGPLHGPREYDDNLTFYFPMFIEIVKQSLRYGFRTFTMVNPAFTVGGPKGNCKSDILRLTGPAVQDKIAQHVLVAREPGACPAQNIREALDERKLEFPLVAKPDMSRSGYGVRRVYNMEDVSTYWDQFPQGADFLLQEIVDLEPEASIIYARDPDTDEVSITSLGLKYAPVVVGDGSSTIAELLETDAHRYARPEKLMNKPSIDYARVPPSGERVALSFTGSFEQGGMYRDGAEFITPEMAKAFDEIARTMGEVYFAKFDFRFESLAALQKGEGFKVLEINGAWSLPVHLQDNRMTREETIEGSRENVRLVFKLGHKLRRKGHKPASYWSQVVAARRQEKLMAQYPASE